MWAAQRSIDAGTQATHALRESFWRLNNTRPPQDPSHFSWFEDDSFMCDALTAALPALGLNGIMQAIVWRQLPLTRPRPPLPLSGA